MKIQELLRLLNEDSSKAISHWFQEAPSTDCNQNCVNQILFDGELKIRDKDIPLADIMNAAEDMGIPDSFPQSYRRRMVRDIKTMHNVITEH